MKQLDDASSKLRVPSTKRIKKLQFRACFIRCISVASNAIQTIDNEVNHLASHSEIIAMLLISILQQPITSYRIAFKLKRRQIQKSIQTFITVVAFHKAHFYALKLTTHRRACRIVDCKPPPPPRSRGIYTLCTVPRMNVQPPLIPRRSFCCLVSSSCLLECVLKTDQS